MNYKDTLKNSYSIRLILILITLSATMLFSSWHSEFSYERSVKFLRNFINEGDLVFDVGANIGNKTFLYVLCKAKVVCFEPEIRCISKLQRKFKDNSNVIIVPKGLAEKQGYIDFFPCNQVTTISSCAIAWATDGRFVEAGYSWAKPIKIEVATLDQMIEQYGIPKFCKIDVEGFEFQVLSGLTQPIPCISFEFTYERKTEAQKCLAILTRLGYKKFNFVIGETAFFFFNEYMDAESLLEKIYKENVVGTGLWGDIYALYTNSDK